MNEPYENITKQIFINKWKNFLDSEQKQVESCGKKSIQHQFQMINADKKLFLKQLELVQFKKEIYSEVNEKLEKQNHALSLANFLLRNKTIAMLNTQIQRLEMEFQNYASFYDFQESELENEEERLIKLVKEKLDNNQLAIFNNLIRKIKGNPTLKTVNESYESSDLINESHLMDQIRINELDSQSKRELVIIKPLDNKNSSENLDIYNEKEAEFGTKQCLTTEIEIVTEKNQNQESYKQTPASFIGKLETNSDGDSKEHILDNKNVKKFAFDFDSLNPKYDFSFFNQTNEDNEENPQQRSGFLFICDEDRENNNLDGSFKFTF
ncbi:hypothetical protein SSS_07929 [Sarcoptes scabiei]|nr:hypothetical protein SSS_07929 [Sarcoptes scabiei]